MRKHVWKRFAGLLAISVMTVGAMSGCGAGDKSGGAEATATEGAEAAAAEGAEATAAESADQAAQPAEGAGQEGTEAAPADTEGGDQTVYADIEVKDYGTISMELYPDVAPVTVANFKKLAENGFYDGLTFHRIMDGFMIQGGDPLGNGTGGADENIVGEFAMNGHENNLSHVRGTVSMARSGDPNSASSQFFIVQTDSTFLDGQYAGFGKVTSGMEIVDQICKDAKPTDDNGTIPAEEQPVMEKVTIR